MLCFSAWMRRRVCVTGYMFILLSNEIFLKGVILDCGRLIISTWGNPAFWKSFKYRVREDAGVVESCTTLEPILRFFGDAGKRTKVFLVVLDSLMDWKDCKDRGEGRYSKCCVCYAECYKGIDFTRIEDYEGLLKINEGLLRCVLDCLGIKGDIDVVVGPALGSPGGEWRFSGPHSSTDFMTVTLHVLGREILCNCYDEIILDLSHGVNFMPSEVMILAQMLASLALLKHEVSEVVVRALNSDPSTKSGEPLNINTIYENAFSLIIMPEFPKHLLKTSNRRLENLRKKTNEIMHYVKKTIKTIYYPLPLALLELCRSSEYPNLINSLEEVMNEWIKETHVSLEEKSVTHDFGIDPRAVYYSLLAHGACEIARNVRPTLNGLKEINEKIYVNVNKAYQYIISNEVSQIETRKEKIKNCIRLSELYGIQGSGIPNERILIAHAGLQSDLIEVCSEGSDLSLKYIKEINLNDMLSRLKLP